MARVQRVFRHLAHPPDRPRDHSCDGFPKACIAPFDYSNPGVTTAGAEAWTVSASDVAAERAAHPHAGDVRRRAAELAHRAMLLRDAQEVENLQRIYGFYLDRAMWDQIADLFADDGTIEMGQRGVYVGKRRIRQFLNLLGHDGLTYGWLNDHIQLQPIVDVAPDGKSARLRSRELDMMGVFGKSGTWSEGTYENTFVKESGVWKLKSLHYYPTFISAYDKGWGEDAQPIPGESSTLPPDHPPTEVYAIYPQAFVPPFHYRNPATGERPHYPQIGAPTAQAAAATLMPAGPRWIAPRAADVEAALAEAQRTIDRVKDYDEIENLESSYGYYLDKDLWTDLSNLFADNGTMELAQRGVYIGREHIFTFLLKGLGRGHEGPSPNMLGNHMQLQPVIDISPDGRTAHMRVYMLQQMAFGPRGSIGAAVYENEAVKVDGIWKFARDHAYNTLGASYSGGWVRAARPQVPGESKAYPPDAPPSAKVAMFPVVYDIPFHYSNPVTGRESVPTPWQDGEASVTQAREATGDPPAGMPPDIAAALREIGPKIDGQRTTALYAPLFPKEPYPNVSLVRDVRYGPNERNVLDIFTAPATGHGATGSRDRRPVVVFIHGGGFSHGTNHMPGTPFYDNVGLWAAAHGLVGVTMTYRLSPKFQFPTGVEDVTTAVRWLKGHIAAYGGDPREIFLWGHSAGAAHVADYVASTPLLVTDAELDPPLMHEQTDELVKALAAAGKPVRRVDVPNHSHLSELYAVGTADQSLSGPVLEFVRQISADPPGR